MTMSICTQSTQTVILSVEKFILKPTRNSQGTVTDQQLASAVPIIFKKQIFCDLFIFYSKTLDDVVFSSFPEHKLIRET